jgi:hypothetical protein
VVNVYTTIIACLLIMASLPVAEGVRFELTVPLPTRRISSPVHSTALPTFRGDTARVPDRPKS